MGTDDPVVNPLYSGRYPVLERLLKSVAEPIDARLDMPGFPQSATGQATLLTGVNAAKGAGRHVEGFPGPTIKAIVKEHNIYGRLLRRGFTCTFANAYHLASLEEVYALRRPSVTTVAALHALQTVRLKDQLLAGEAVYQDITRENLRARGMDIPVISVREAAHHLMQIASDHEFTLFEYFQTDLMAHKGTPEDVDRVLRNLNEFMETLLPFADEPEQLLIMTSDHGNIEDARSRSHTMNPVPFLALGASAVRMRADVRRLEDVTPALLARYA